MCESHEREHGSAYHSYAAQYEYPERDPLMVYVRFHILPSTEHRLIVRDTGKGHGEPEPNGEVSKEIAKVDKFRSLIAKTFPIMKHINFSIAASGACMWMLFYDPDSNTALYESWRQSAWTMWDGGISTIAAEADLKTRDINVQPLPGPWRYAFL